MNVRVFSLFVTATLLAGCAPAASPARSTVSLRLRGRPAQAIVVIDDEPLGTLGFVAIRGVALPPGAHRITVAADGFFPWDRAIEAKEGSPPMVFDATLIPIPD
jgi:hypothetical protein